MKLKVLQIFILFVLNSPLGHSRDAQNADYIQSKRKNFITDFIRYAKADHANMEMITDFIHDSLDPQALVEIIRGYGKTNNNSLALNIAKFIPKALDLYENLRSPNSTFPKNRCSRAIKIWFERLKVWDEWALSSDNIDFVHLITNGKPWTAISCYLATLQHGGLGLGRQLTEVESIQSIISMEIKQHKVPSITRIDNCESENSKLFVGTAALSAESVLSILKMLDATAKPQTGFLQGNIVEVGNIDECAQIKATVGNETIRGKYCSTVGNTKRIYKLVLPDNMMVKDVDFSYGLCIPDVCNEDEINEIVHYISDSLEIPFYLHFIEDFCFVEQTKPLSTNDMLAIAFFTVTGIIMFLSTVYDIFIFQRRKESGKQFSMLIVFSVYTNMKKITSTKKTENDLTCLNGMRVISMMWIILGHLYGIVLMMPKANFLDFLKVHESIEGAFPMAANLAVDTFFAIGGLLVSYAFLTLEDRKISINFFWFYLHRFIRLTPSLLALIIFSVTLMDRMAYGPFWTLAVYKIKNTCVKNWWSTMLYIQNYVNPTNMCLSHTWYIAVDMQFCIITPPLLIMLRRKPKLTLSFVALMGVLSCTAFFILTWFYDIGPSAVGFTDVVLKYVYVTPHTRASTWMIGFLFGYVLHNFKGKPLKLATFTKTSAWVVIMSVMIGLVLYHKRFLNQGPWPLLETALFNTLTRPLWSIALCGIIFLCVSGHGDVINSFLSKPIFSILIRLNYNVYLTHVIALVYTYGSFKTPYFGETGRVLIDFWSIYALTLVMALIWTLAFESPFIAIERNLRKKNGKSEESVKANNHTPVHNA